MALMRMSLSALSRSKFGAQTLSRFSANGKPRPRDNMVNFFSLFFCLLYEWKLDKNKIAHTKVFGFVACNFLSTHRLTKNIELIAEDNVSFRPDNKFVINPHTDDHRPLLVLLCWLQSKRKHTMKFVNFYMEQGFDVVTVSINPWQLMWPVNGSRVSNFHVFFSEIY